MGACEVCDEAPPAKYRCPACAVATCSLACSKLHKTLGGGCSGKRDRAAFKDIREFTDADVINDYRFLEEALLEKDRAKRWRPEYTPGTEAAQRSERPPASAKIVATLTREARARASSCSACPRYGAASRTPVLRPPTERHAVEGRGTFHAAGEGTKR